jgi:hypothetical protein
MGTFYDDKHAPERASNVYFPFQSKGEWELVSFLSQSGLSMKRIDEFLSLDLVRYQVAVFFSITHAEPISRYLGFTSHSIVLGRCVVSWSFSRVGHPGNQQLSLFRDTRRKIHWSYITAIPSNALKPSSRIHSSPGRYNTFLAWSTMDTVNDATVNG